MAILDKERARGLRIPSLSAMKLHKKSAPMSPESSPPQDPMPVAAMPPPAFPARTDSAPVRPPRPHEKELPPNPLLESANISPSSPPAPTPFSNPIHPYNDRPLPSFPRVPVPKPAETHVPPPAPVQQRTPPSSESEPEPELERVPAPLPHQHHQHPPRPPPQPQYRREPVPAPRRDPYPVQPPYHEREQDQPSGAEDPLEDFIPEPEPELDGSDTAIEPASSEENNGPWTPPDYDPVAAPLNKLHFSCYQQHRSMRPAQNMWHPLPCMTCQKFDQELRYRCVFCCLRICAGCLSTLQKCPNRSLEQLMARVSEGVQREQSDDV